MSVAPPKFYQWTEENIQTSPITDDYSLCVLKVPQGARICTAPTRFGDGLST